MIAPQPRDSASRSRLWMLFALDGVLAVITIGVLAGRYETAGLPLGSPILVAVLTLVFLVCESTQIHLQLRRQVQSFSLSEVALVIGLFTLPASWHPGCADSRHPHLVHGATRVGNEVRLQRALVRC